jgi:8-oxo-dGTP pyrophosphatase MutT (NUDIX family)
VDDLRALVGDLRESLWSTFFGRWQKDKDERASDKPGKKPEPEPEQAWKHGGSEPPKQQAPRDETPKPGQTKQPEKWTSAGCVILPSLHPDDLNYVYVIKPSNNYGPWAFPKGRVDPGENFRETARREVGEETGLAVSLLPGGYLGKGVGRYSTTHYFMAVQVGGSPGQHDQEVEKVRLVAFEDAFKLFAKDGNKRDIEILKKAWKYTEKFRQRTGKRPTGSMEPVSKTQGTKKGYGTGYPKKQPW